MKTIALIAVFCLSAVFANAASLQWESQPANGSIIVERADTPSGPFTMVATVPQGTTQFILTPGVWGHYRARTAAGPSNTAQYSADLYSGGVLARLDLIEGRLHALEVPVSSPPPTPPPTANITARQVDPDHIEVVGTTCTSVRTTGTGLRRLLECVH